MTNRQYQTGCHETAGWWVKIIMSFGFSAEKAINIFLEACEEFEEMNKEKGKNGTSKKR